MIALFKIEVPDGDYCRWFEGCRFKRCRYFSDKMQIARCEKGVGLPVEISEDCFPSGFQYKKPVICQALDTEKSIHVGFIEEGG